MKILTVLITLIALTTYISAAEAGSQTITTYYPAPSGHYDTLQLTTGIDEKKACGQDSDGVVFIDANGDIQTCKGQKAAGGSSWKLADSLSVPGTKMLTPPSNVNTLFISQRVGIGADPAKLSANDKLAVGGGITVSPAAATAAAPASNASSRIVFYLLDTPQLYVGVTEDTTGSVLSFFGPEENAVDSFFTIDNASGNMGIGNNAPTQKLDVTGAIKSSDQIIADKDIVTGGKISLTDSPVGTVAAEDPSISRGTDKALNITGGYKAGKKMVNIADYLQVNGTANVSGNVGIGLSEDPLAPLEVNGIILATTPTETDPGNAVVTKEYLSSNATACFNRFCSYSTSTGNGTCSISCPSDYPQLSGVEDDFVSDNYTTSGTAYTTHVRSIVCCK